MDLYTETILDHYQTPHNAGEISDHTTRIVEANSLCGDTIQLDLKIKKGTIVEVGFVGNGCAISQASMSLLSDEIKGKKISSLKKMKSQKVYQLLQVPISPGRVKCALLGFSALQQALLKIKK
ncbi:MAG: hypothetical protein ACD_72C00437G0003 [uncultured bacterium]|nr:MAG: hypothetical protein ACD_72C00437G0003 [uncultured bacterium]